MVAVPIEQRQQAQTAQDRNPLARIPVARRSLKASASRPLSWRFQIKGKVLRKTGIRWRGFRSREDP
jgi:hypothetical protein